MEPDRAKGVSCVEGMHRFQFEAGYEVCRFECSHYYSRQAQNFCNSCKEMDFVLYHPGKRDLWLVEVKDYRFDARPRVRELVDALCRKVRDTLFLLRAGAFSAPLEYPDEGISLREMARLSLEAKRVHLAFLLELDTKGIFAGGGMLSNIKDMLSRQLSFIDPEMVCVPITRSQGQGPWFVTPAGGEHSARVERRLEQVRLQREQEKRRAAARENSRKVRNPAGEQSIPRWKRRLEERQIGLGGNHASRRRQQRKKNGGAPRGDEDPSI